MWIECHPYKMEVVGSTPAMGTQIEIMTKVTRYKRMVSSFDRRKRKL